MAEIKRLHGGCLVGLALVSLCALCNVWNVGVMQNEVERSGAPGMEQVAAAFGFGTIFLFLLGVVGFFIVLGFFHVPIGHIAITSGGRVYGDDRAGWKWHPFGRMLSLELIEMRNRNYALQPFPVRTRDQAEFDVYVAVNWRPDPESIPTYIEHGREAVAETLGNVITTRLTKWAYNAGPEDWREAFGAHDLSKEALIDELSHAPSGAALVPATSSLMVPGDIATYRYRPLGIVIGGVYVKHIEARFGSKFSAKDLMQEATFNLPFDKQLTRAVKDIEDIDKLERQRAQMIEKFPERKAEIDRKFNQLKSALFDQ